ncbi:hypothetical protein BVC80_8825g30 [Macleaya cordata]|uniref:Armadillo-like repeats domain-containing protein n=1 Tax=Macleaya cordata TaxID=56857 RepID=A0A200QAE8_MACCD|nr:hypothetical protein BVC80_8825g30 [Macleaya cordata]
MASSSSSYLVGPSTAAAASKLRHSELRLKNGTFAFPNPSSPLLIPYWQKCSPVTRLSVSTMAKKKSEETSAAVQQLQKNPREEKKLEDDEEEVEEDLPWIQEKAMDLVEFTGSVTQAIPGPRVGASSLPWILAVPLGYLGITFVNKNAMLCTSIDELFQKGRDEVHHSTLKELMEKTGFDMEEVLRKYIRYAMNEKPFNPDMVANLIQLRKASMLNDTEVAEILNEISRRIVRDKGPVVMDISGYSEKGFKRKLAVQALFGKIFYLSELPEFCSKDGSLIIKDIFGVTDEDAVTLRTHTLSEAGDVESLEKMLGNSDSEEPDDGSSNDASQD